MAAKGIGVKPTPRRAVSCFILKNLYYRSRKQLTEFNAFKFSYNFPSNIIVTDFRLLRREILLRGTETYYDVQIDRSASFVADAKKSKARNDQLYQVDQDLAV